MAEKTVARKPEKVKKDWKSSGIGEILYRMSKNRTAMVGLIIFVVEILLAILAPLIAPYEYNSMSSDIQVGPCLAHWFGTDDLGRDILSRILIGARYSLSMGVLAVLLGTAAGMVLGAIAGYFGGQVDNIMMRLLDIVQALPNMLLMVVIAAVLGSGYVNTIIALSISQIPGVARLLRAEMLKERENEYVEASISINCSKFRIIANHLIPNCSSPIIVQATMGVATAITTASALSFIGLGVQPPIPEWGAMLSGVRAYIRQSPHMVIFPGLAIAITVLALNLMGDGLRDALDPKLKN